MIVWHNSRFIEKDAYGWALRDRVRLGDGVFDTMLSLDGRLICPQAHMERLARHAGVLALPVSCTAEELIAAAGEILKRNDFMRRRYALNTVITRGVSKRGLMPPDTPDVNIMIFASPVPESFEALHVIVAQSVRRNEGSPLSQIKSCNYGDNILALLEAKKKGANEVLMLNNKGHLASFSAGNVYAVLRDGIYTPPLPDGAMDGIIRQRLIEGHGVKEKSLTEKDLHSAQGIYLSNSIRCVVPVSSYEGKTLRLDAWDIDPALYLA